MLGPVGATRIPAFSPKELLGARTRRGWSQGRLAAALEVSVNTVGGWERGERTPGPPVFLAMARELQVDPALLLSVPRALWTLLELRAVAGLHQAAAAKELNINPTTLSHIELAYAEIPDDRLEDFARVYRSTPNEITRCWKRTRTRLLQQ